MNKQDAIERIKNIDTLTVNDNITGQKVDMVIKSQVLEIISKIHEPQKPVVPKFVAEWIKGMKQDERPLYSVMSSLMNKTNHEWTVWKSANMNFSEILAQAWLDGYEIEKEKLYTVEIPNPNSNWKYTFLAKKDNRGVLIHKTDDDCWKADKISQLTESEIKEDFEWAFQFAKPVEE